MGGPRRKTSQARRSSQKTSGRVVDMRSWKAKKQVRQARRARTTLSWRPSLVVTAVLTAFCALASLVSLFPSNVQIPGVIFSWFFGVLAIAWGMLFASRNRLTPRLLLIATGGLTVSLIAACVHLAVTPH